MIDPFAMAGGFLAYSLAHIVVSLPRRRQVRRRLETLSRSFREIGCADMGSPPDEQPYFPHRFGSQGMWRSRQESNL